MKRKIIIVIGAFSLLFLLSGIYVLATIEKTTDKMDNLIRLHRIEILREHLLIHLKRAQSDLYLKNTRYARSIDTIVTHVQTMDTSLTTCFNCHHNASVAKRLNDLKNRIELYKSALSRVFTIRANKNRLEAEEDNAFKIGTELILEVDDITAMTSRKLEERTRAALKGIGRTKNILYLLLAGVPLVALGLSIVFLRSFTKPVDVLLAATRELKAGDLDYRIKGLHDEYGEVAASFNEMASSLKEHYLRMQWAEQVVVLGELTSGLAHEIRNPIAGIKGVMEILSGDPSLSEKNKDILLRAIEQIKRVEFLLKSFLNFAQPPRPQFVHVNMNELLESMISLAKNHPLFLPNHSRMVTIVRNLDSSLPKIMVDPMQIQQVFMNLLLNAAEAMPNGGTVTVQTSYQEGSPLLHITITDTGKGIDKSIINKIYQPFFTTKPTGTGLGLAITRRLVEQHGGSIHAANNQAGGVSFTIDIPINRIENPTVID